MSPSGKSFRVALVAACEFPSTRGSQALIAGIAELLAQRGHGVHVVSFAAAADGAVPAGIRVHRPRSRPGRTLPPGPSFRRLLDDAQLVVTLYRVVRGHGIDVIHAHNYEAAIAACLVRMVTGTPVVYHAHNVLSDELEFYAASPRRRRVARALGRWLDRWVPRQADFTIALTVEVAEFLELCDVDPERLRVVPPVISGLLVAAERGLAGRPPGAAKFVVAYAGNLDPYQDLEVLGGGFARFSAATPDVELVIATHEHEWRERLCPQLQRLVDQGLARVLVTVDAAATQRLLEAADVLVCPRRSWSGYPMKLFNYAAAAKPIVAAAGSAGKLRDGDEVLVFADGDESGLASALDRMHADQGLRRRLSRGAEALGRRMADSAGTAEAFESIYQTVDVGSVLGASFDHQS